MKKVLGIIMTFTLILLLTGCNKFKIQAKSPESDSIIKGQWKVQSYVGTAEEEVLSCDLQGSIVSFSNEEVFMFDKTYKNITYKAKVVNGEEYIYNYIGFVPDYLKGSKDIVVVTISSKNTYLKEVMVVDGGILIIQDDVLIYLEKVDDKPMKNMNVEEGTKERKEEVSSGVLIGLKDETDEGVTYKTIWIAHDGEKISSQELPFILLPRKNGFYKVLASRTNNENSYKDDIQFDFLGGNTPELKMDAKAYKESNINISKEITFIGNDYISIKTKEEGSFNKSEEVVGTYLIDTMNGPGKGALALGNISEHKNMTEFNKVAQGLYIDDISTFSNVFIERNHGRWGLYTTNIKKAEESSENNIEIPLKVSKNVARYDKLFMSWQGIKNQVPSAVDAVSSPNKNMVIIKTKSSLYVYKIENGKINESPDLTISLNEDEDIVMAEWAMGEYVGYWTEEVNSLNK